MRIFAILFCVMGFSFASADNKSPAENTVYLLNCQARMHSQKKSFAEVSASVNPHYIFQNKGLIGTNRRGFYKFSSSGEIEFCEANWPKKDKDEYARNFTGKCESSKALSKKGYSALDGETRKMAKRLGEHYYESKASYDQAWTAFDGEKGQKICSQANGVALSFEQGITNHQGGSDSGGSTTGPGQPGGGNAESGGGSSDGGSSSGGSTSR